MRGLSTFARLAGCLAALLAGTSGASALEAKLGYVVTLRGLNIAALDVGLSDNGDRYGIELNADVSGLGSLVASGTARVSASGLVQGDRLVPAVFDLLTTAGGEDFSSSVRFAGGDVSSFVVEPPLVDNYGRVPIERSHLTDVVDAISAFALTGDALDRSLCERKLRIFTGVERFDIALRFVSLDTATSPRTGYQGPVVLCNVVYTPISGHFTASEVTTFLAQSDRILIWYAPLGESGYFIPYRLLLTTGVGDLSVVLTRMEP